MVNSIMTLQHILDEDDPCLSHCMAQSGDNDALCLCTSQRGGDVLWEEANECLLNCEEKDISFPGRRWRRSLNVSAEFLQFLPKGRLREECLKRSHKRRGDNPQVISKVRSHSRPEKKDQNPMIGNTFRLKLTILFYIVRACWKFLITLTFIYFPIVSFLACMHSYMYVYT